MSLYKYLKRGGVNVTIKEFALFHNNTNQTLRNYYKERTEKLSREKNIKINTDTHTQTWNTTQP